MATTGAVSADVNVRDLLGAGLHFGHQTKRWNPKMKRFIFDERNGIYIIDLAKSLAHLKEAQQFIYDTVGRGRKVLFVGTKKQAQDSIKEAASKLGQPYIVHRWLGGTLTNHQTVRQSVATMRELERQEEDGTIGGGSKKEAARLRRELTKLQRNLSGIADLEDMPGALFVVDVNREAIAVAEANRLKIPVVAILDTNCNPDNIDYPIPGNDDAIRAIQLVINTLSQTIQQASNEWAKIQAEEARRRAQEEADAAARATKAEEERKAREEAEKKAREEAAIKAALEAKKKAKEEAAKPAPEAEKPATPAAPSAKAPAPAEEAKTDKAPAAVPEAAQDAPAEDKAAAAVAGDEKKA